MEQQRRVLCAENEELAKYMLQKRQEMADKPKGLSENVDITLSKAYSNICNAKNPIKTLKDLSQIKGVGKWILKLMQGFFETGSSNSEPEDLLNKGKKPKEVKRYMPQRSSVAYALLITLHRGTANGNEFMRKQELIDAAEASGLSRVPIAPEKGRGKPAQFGSSPRDWYSGWSCMKTLVTKGLVVKSSCPAKYMLTLEGREVARECLMRSRLADTAANLADDRVSDLEFARLSSAREVALPSVGMSGQKKSIDVPPESLERFTRMGYSKEQVRHAFSEVLETSQNKEISSLWPTVLCRLQEDQVYGSQSESLSLMENCLGTSTTNTFTSEVNPIGRQNNLMDSARYGGRIADSYSAASAPTMFTMRVCSSSDHLAQKSRSDGLEAKINILSVPPLGFGERFEDVYTVMLILDDREQFASKGSRSRKIIDNISSEFKIQIQVRRLPVGDGIWIARHKYLHSEYVLDFIVERKKVDDLRSSIRDNRYKDQKLRLLRCGLKKLIYLVEGDPNFSEAAESIKTATC